MRAAAPQTPIVVLSGQDDEETTLRALHMGAQDYLLKGRTESDTIARSIRYAIERARTEEELRQSEERFRLLVQGVRDYAIFMLDPGGRVESWNEAAAHKRVPGERDSRRALLYFLHRRGCREGCPEEHLRIAAADGRYEEEGLRVRKDGSTFWAETVITASRDVAGQLHGFSNITRDITGRKEAEEALRSSPKGACRPQVRSRRVGNHRHGRREGYDHLCKRQVLRGLQVLQRRVSSRDHRIVDPAYHPERFVDGLWRTITRGEVWRREIKHPARDGTYYWLDATIVPSLDERGEPYRYVAICNDITRRKEAEEALRRSLEGLANLKFAVHDEEVRAGVGGSWTPTTRGVPSREG